MVLSLTQDGDTCSMEGAREAVRTAATVPKVFAIKSVLFLLEEEV